MALQRDDLNGTIDSDVQREILDWFHRMQNSIDASHSWYETSCHSLPEYWECDGNKLLSWKDHGYITVFDLLQVLVAMAEFQKIKKSSIEFFNFLSPFLIDQNKIPTIGSSANASAVDILPLIRFNKNVRKITYNAQAHAIDSLTRIDCADKSSYFANHLICTMSLGVLKKRHVQLFEPILPTWKIVAIDGLMFGTVDKIYVEFEQSFWPDEWDGFSMLWKPEQLKEVQADPSHCDWLEGLVGFFPFNGQPHMLCGWITGPTAHAMELKSDGDIRMGIEKIFQIFLRDQSVSKITNIIR